jgi:hypothetical protein
MDDLRSFLIEMGLEKGHVAYFPPRKEALEKGFYNRFNLDENGEPLF